MEIYEALTPVAVGFLRPAAVMERPEGLTQPMQEPGPRRLGLGILCKERAVLTYAPSISASGSK